MEPFFALDLDLDASDEQVARRYHELVASHPPDVDPERFIVIRAAYERLRTRRDRIAARMFYIDETGRSLADEQVSGLAAGERPRLTPAQLAGLLGRGSAG